MEKGRCITQEFRGFVKYVFYKFAEKDVGKVRCPSETINFFAGNGAVVCCLEGLWSTDLRMETRIDIGPLGAAAS